MINTGLRWGEWLEPDISMQESVKAMLFHGVPDIAMAYYAYSSKMMAEIAGTLVRTEDAEHYKKLAENAIKAYNYLEVKNGHISSDRQCRYVRPLYIGLLSEEDAHFGDIGVASLNHYSKGAVVSWLTAPGHGCSRFLCAHYERIYDSMAEAIEGRTEKCVKDEEVVRVLEILEEATAVAKSHKM